MKTVEELKQEQHDLKARLHEVVEIINSKEYFELSPREKGLIGQQRAGMEMYLNALTNRIYSKDEYSFDSSNLFMLPLLSSMFSSPLSGSLSKGETNNQKEDQNTSESKEKLYQIPV